MEKQDSGQLLKEKFIGLYQDQKEVIEHNDPSFISKLRNEAIGFFDQVGFPNQGLEEWRNTKLSDALIPEYNVFLHPLAEIVDINKIFSCEVHNFETYLVTQLNGWYVYQNSPLSTLENGVIIGSLARAKEKYPDIFEKHYGKYADIHKDGLTALNTAFAMDGIFIYVPDNVQVSTPIQMVNIVNISEDIFIQTRNLVILGKNSTLSLAHCDDSIRHKNSFINTVSEIYVDENAGIDYYKLQNKDDKSTMVTTTVFEQQANSRVNAHTITLNGGIIRNNTRVSLNGRGADANIYGLYLMDRKQHIDNQVYVDHAVPDCRSNELFKGIMDEEASAVFNGHILVRKDAQQTNAYQNNKNILLTDEAKVNTKPFLEIYADNVKCSHGATVGQLDPQAMFYLKSRGICDRSARMLLMYAFAAEVVNKIPIETLRRRIDAMVAKRLRGELSICDQCMLHCKDDDVINFDIDMSKI